MEWTPVYNKLPRNLNPRKNATQKSIKLRKQNIFRYLVKKSWILFYGGQEF